MMIFTIMNRETK